MLLLCFLERVPISKSSTTTFSTALTAGRTVVRELPNRCAVCTRTTSCRCTEKSSGRALCDQENLRASHTVVLQSSISDQVRLYLLHSLRTTQWLLSCRRRQDRQQSMLRRNLQSQDYLALVFTLPLCFFFFPNFFFLFHSPEKRGNMPILFSSYFEERSQWKLTTSQIFPFCRIRWDC